MGGWLIESLSIFIYFYRSLLIFHGTISFYLFFIDVYRFLSQPVWLKLIELGKVPIHVTNVTLSWPGWPSCTTGTYLRVFETAFLVSPTIEHEIVPF